MPLPQVVVTEGTELPTGKALAPAFCLERCPSYLSPLTTSLHRRPRPAALSWLRRRGPPLPESTLHRLFRQESIRLWDPAAQRVRRVSKGRLLEPGCMLLLPNSAVAAAATPGQQPADAQQQQQLSPVARRQRVAAAQDLRACLLHIDADLLAVNKPAGLATQGGRGIAHSVDSLMGEAFRGLPGLDPARLRLVHRLDRQTTGAGWRGGVVACPPLAVQEHGLLHIPIRC